MNVPENRVHAVNDLPTNPSGDYVLYWMIAHRRTRYSFGLQHAAQRAIELGVPLVVFEALRAGYAWASDRLHQFVIDGMHDNAARCAEAGVTCFSYVEPMPGDGRGLLKTLAGPACLVVTDEFPCFFLPRMVAAAGSKIGVRLEQVDGNGLMPLRGCDKPHKTAAGFRRHLQKVLPRHLTEMPVEDPLIGDLAGAVLPDLSRWHTDFDALDLADLPIDHEVKPTQMKGGPIAAEARLKAFVDDELDVYPERRNHPDDDGGSHLSPYLHFGHIGVHDVFASVAAHEGWTRDSLAEKPNGARAGWWGMSAPAEGFIDELITWREVGYGFSFHRADYQRYDSLPEWALGTLADHATDPREWTYTLDEFEHSKTHDPIWNAAQRQLVRDGRMHNYLRMLWGKKILEWSPTPQRALSVMIELNNRYALDGRNPNSYSGIFWTLGRFDRGWPERAIFGKIRCMTSASTQRKVRLKQYLIKYGPKSD